jgi:signal transduction histidine kinase
LIFQVLRPYTLQLAEKIFLQGSYNTDVVLERLSIDLLKFGTLRKIMTNSLKLLCDSIRVDYAYFAAWEGDVEYESVSFGSSAKRNPQSSALYALSQDIKHQDTVVLISDISKDLDMQKNFDCAVVLRKDGKLVGTLFFGPKSNGKSFTKNDMTLLRISAGNLGVAVDNARNYEEISQFAEKLKTEIKKATLQLQKANTKLENISKAKDEFMSMATHQIRPQLAAVRGFIEMLENSDASVEQKDLLQWAHTGVERSIRIIADMLNLTQFASGAIRVDLRRAELGEMIENEVRLVQSISRSSGVTLSYKRPAEKAAILADETKLREVIANFCSNAVQYSARGSRVEVKVEKIALTWKFSVIDSGMGVSKAARSKLFKKFYRADEARTMRPTGTGVGLFLAETVIKAHGGKVFYEPRAEGSIFGFILKAEKD